MRLPSVAVGLLSIVVAASRLAGQNLDLTPPSRVTDIRMELPSGTIVHARNFVIFEKRHAAGSSSASSLTVYIETPTSATDSARLAREAREVAQLEDGFAQKHGVSQVAVAICRTRACVELREAPSREFWFTRAKDGRWRIEKPSS